MISGNIQIKSRYDEVDQMGYIYHANYVKYCHIGRTELMRQFNIHDECLEENNILLPVIEMNLQYLKPAKYDDLLTINTRIAELPKTRLFFNFEIRNEKEEIICKANSTIVFVDSNSRKPMKAPKIILDALSTKTAL